MLGTRLLVSAVLIPLFIALCWFDARLGRSAVILMPLALLISLQASLEIAALLKLPKLSRSGVVAGNLLILLAFWGAHVLLPERLWSDPVVAMLLPIGVAGLAFVGLVQMVLFVRLSQFREPGEHIPRLSGEVFALSYIGMLLVTVASLRWVGEGQLGYLALGSLVIGAKIGDVGGYTFGRLFGKKKLAPSLSPGKTRAGALGAILTAAVGTALWIRFAGPLFAPDAMIGAWPHLLAFGTLLGIVGLIGDLAESLLKRDAGLKDASHLMPAFGGLLDLIDSILYTGPVALLVWLAWPPVV